MIAVAIVYRDCLFSYEPSSLINASIVTVNCRALSRLASMTILLTNPGEWANNPDFGCGLKMLGFTHSNAEFIASTQKLVHHSPEKWVDDRIKVEAVQVNTIEGLLELSISYILSSCSNQYTAVYSIHR